MGVSPEIEAVQLADSPTTGAATWTCPTWRPGAMMYFPVQRRGRLFLRRRLPRAAGRRRALRRRGRDPGHDHHPARSDQGLEHRLASGWRTSDFIMAVGSARPMEDAARMAYRDLIRWLVRRLRLRGGGGLFPPAPRPGGCGWATWSTRSTRSGASMLKKLPGLNEGTRWILGLGGTARARHRRQQGHRAALCRHPRRRGRERLDLRPQRRRGRGGRRKRCGARASPPSAVRWTWPTRRRSRPGSRPAPRRWAGSTSSSPTSSALAVGDNEESWATGVRDRPDAHRAHW